MSHELVINWHITEKCNFSCEFCYAKYGLENQFKREIHNNRNDVKSVISLLSAYFSKHAPSVRLNIAGGEPFLVKNIVDIFHIAKEHNLKTSFITNGSAINIASAKQLAPIVSIAGFSIDSIDNNTNRLIGRQSKTNKQISEKSLLTLIEIFREQSVQIKINTVVSSFNKAEDMSSFISLAKPDKWKIFQTLPVFESSLNVAVSKKEFMEYIARHSAFNDFIYHENNEEMVASYIMIDPMGRFYQNNTDGLNGYTFSSKILEVGAEAAFRQIDFSSEKFSSRYKK